MISIVILNYNTFELTKACIHSIFEKTKDISFEIILVDNASTERDPDLFLCDFPEVNLIKSPTNLGFAKGNNLGIEKARGKYILLLNSDTKLLNNAIREAYDILESDVEIGVLSGQLQYENKSLQSVAGRFSTIQRELLEFFRFSKLIPTKKRAQYYLGTEADYAKPLDCDWVWGAFFMFRRADLNQFPNGKLHEDFFMYYEDVQWCYHFKHKLKKKVRYSPKPKAVHYIGASSTDTVDSNQKFFKTILPNQYRWMVKEKGWMYTKLYYAIRTLHYFSLRTTQDKWKGQQYFKLVKSGI